MAQDGLANALMMYRDKEATNMNFQDVKETNRLLNSKSVNNVDDYSAQELCQILGVDAVVKQHYYKERLMSDYESYGLDIANEILQVIPIPGLPTTTPLPDNKTYTVKKPSDLVKWDG